MPGSYSTRRRPTAALLCLGLLAAAAPARAAHKRYIVVPEVEWVEILPYLRAHIVTYLHEDQFDVYICAEKIDRSVVQPYDEPLGDFVKVFLHETIQQDRGVRQAIETTAEAFRTRLSGLTPDERQRFRDVYWTTLRTAPGFFDGLRSSFEQTLRKGRLRCRGCEQDPGFAPSTVPSPES